MHNDQTIFVQCPDCSDTFRVLFNGEEIVRCPNRECASYLYMSIEAQKEAQETNQGTSYFADIEVPDLAGDKNPVVAVAECIP